MHGSGINADLALATGETLNKRVCCVPFSIEHVQARGVITKGKPPALPGDS
jgi:hypothetical protein